MQWKKMPFTGRDGILTLQNTAKVEYYFQGAKRGKLPNPNRRENMGVVCCIHLDLSKTTGLQQRYKVY